MLLVSRMAGQENLDRDLRDFQPPKKKVKTTRESGARFKCLTREEMVVLSKGVESSEIDNPSVRFVRFTKVEQHPDA